MGNKNKILKSLYIFKIKIACKYNNYQLESTPEGFNVYFNNKKTRKPVAIHGFSTRETIKIGVFV
jgi:hypothetical protein